MTMKTAFAAAGVALFGFSAQTDVSAKETGRTVRQLKKVFAWELKAHGRPVICTEWMHRPR